MCISATIIRSPCLYVWRRGGNALYVGMSATGVGRPFDATHHRLRGMQAMDTIEVFLFPGLSPHDLAREERRLIERLEPALNNKHGRRPSRHNGTEAMF